jgi:flagellar protein FliO/FliZ
MADFIWYALLSIAMAVIVVGALWLMRGYFNGAPPRLSSFFGPKAAPRLGVVDHANVDSRRRLVLVRRDNVEHLIMTGGPVDVVIETGIPAPVVESAEHIGALPEAQTSLHAQPVFTRAPKTLGTPAASPAAAGSTEGPAG